MGEFRSFNRVMDRPEVLTKDEMVRCLGVSQSNAESGLTSRSAEVEQILLLSAVMGLRASEINFLDISDVSVGACAEEQYVRVVGGKCRKAGFRGLRKDHSEYVPIPDEHCFSRLVWYRNRRLSAGADLCDPWILTPRSRKRPGRKTLWRWFKDEAISCLPESRRRELSLHNGRHTAGTMMVARGEDLPTVASFLRHRNMEMTLRYLHGKPVSRQVMYDVDCIESGVSVGHFVRDRVITELLELDLSTPMECYMRGSLVSEFRRCGMMGRFEDVRGQVLSLLGELGLQSDRSRATVIMWRWASLHFLGKDCDYARGRREDGAGSGIISDVAGSRG